MSTAMLGDIPVPPLHQSVEDQCRLYCRLSGNKWQAQKHRSGESRAGRGKCTTGPNIGAEIHGKSMAETGTKQNEKSMRNRLRKYLSGKVRNCLTKVGTGDIVSSC
jgi:hypothetical protein